MPYHLTTIGVLVQTDPARAADELEAVFRDQRGVQMDVARALHVSPSTVKRWVAALAPHDMRERIERIRDDCL